MLPIRTILHPTDFSPYSEYAMHLASALARDYGARLVVAHVKYPPVAIYGDVGAVSVEPEGYSRELKEKLEKVRPADPDILVEHRLLEGNAADEIVRLAREGATDLIVMGTHGRTGLSRLLMGSVAEVVLRYAPCPVLTVKSDFVEDVLASREAISEPARA